MGKKDRRETTLEVFLKTDEQAQIRQQADQDGLSMSSFARQALLRALRAEPRGRPKETP